MGAGGLLFTVPKHCPAVRSHQGPLEALGLMWDAQQDQRRYIWDYFDLQGPWLESRKL